MEGISDRIAAFLRLNSGYGYGSGHGSGHGSGYGDSDGSGSGYGYSDVSGSVSGSGYGHGSGYGDSDGSVYGYGSGYGDGHGDGSGSGYGYSDGHGYGSGHGDDVRSFDGNPVYLIDDVQTLIDQVHGNVAHGFIFNEDLTLSPCYIVKDSRHFAHGETLRKAQYALLQKEFDDMSEEERISAFLDAHELDFTYANADFFEWHHRLTGSCEMGRKQFAKDHGISLDGEMTTRSFLILTSTAYGYQVIRAVMDKLGIPFSNNTV